MITEENLKYPKPKRPKSYSDQQNLLLLSDKEDYNHVRKLLDKFKRSGVWVCIIKFLEIIHPGFILCVNKRLISGFKFSNNCLKCFCINKRLISGFKFSK